MSLRLGVFQTTWKHHEIPADIQIILNVTRAPANVAGVLTKAQTNIQGGKTAKSQMIFTSSDLLKYNYLKMKFIGVLIKYKCSRMVT